MPEGNLIPDDTARRHGVPDSLAVSRAIGKQPIGRHAGLARQQARLPISLSTVTDICMLVTSDLDRDPRVQKEALSASKAGLSVTVVCRSATIRPSDYHVVSLDAGRAETRLLKYAERLVINVRLAKEAIRSHARLIHANDIDTMPAALSAARVLGVPCLFDAHEYYCDAARDMGWIGHKVAHWAEGIFARRADRVITVSQSLASAMASELRIPTPLVVTNAARFEDCSKCAPLPWRAELGDSKVVLFQGKYCIGRMLEETIDASCHFPPGVVLAMRGFGPLERELRARVDRTSAPVVFLDPVPMFGMVRAAVGADLGLFPCDIRLKTHLHSSPNKLFEYTMAGVPTIATDAPDTRRVIEQHSIGRLYDAEDAEDLARVVIDALSNPSSLRTLRENCLSAARTLCWESESLGLLKVYKELLDRH